MIDLLADLDRATVAFSSAAGLLGPNEPWLAVVLSRAGAFLSQELSAGGQRLGRIEATDGDARALEPHQISPEDVVRLSRFAMARTKDDELVLESSASGTRFVVLDDALCGLVARLACPRAVSSLASTGTWTTEIIGFLCAAGLVERESAGTFASEGPAWGAWEFHDRLMHTRSRIGRYDDPLGAVGTGPGPPSRPLWEGPGGTVTPLPTPDMNTVVASDPSLTETIQSRRSVREYDAEPVTLAELGEFLYRTARTDVIDDGFAGDARQRLWRPYPSDGGAYELEVFVTINRCRDLASEVYFYDSVRHALVTTGADEATRGALISIASFAPDPTSQPDVLVSLTARMDRLTWKYRGIAYALVLRHTGVVQQTMYLVATAMGLAPCALGLGDSALSERAFGLDGVRHVAVGEFVLGRRPRARSNER